MPPTTKVIWRDPTYPVKLLLVPDSSTCGLARVTEEDYQTIIKPQP